MHCSGARASRDECRLNMNVCVRKSFGLNGAEGSIITEGRKCSMSSYAVMVFFVVCVLVLCGAGTVQRRSTSGQYSYRSREKGGPDQARVQLAWVQDSQGGYRLFVLSCCHHLFTTTVLLPLLWLPHASLSSGKAHPKCI